MSRAVAGTAAAVAMSPAAVRVRKSFKLSLPFVRDDFVRVFFEAKRRADAGVHPRLWPQAVAHSAKSAMRGVLARRVWGSRCKLKFKTLCRQFVGEYIDACHVTARASEAGH